MQLLLSYSWPGNVRELENVIERAVTPETGEAIGVGALPPSMRGTLAPSGEWPGEIDIPDAGLDLENVLGDLEKAVLTEALRRTGGVRKEAARLLGITFRSIRYRLLKHDLEFKE